MKAFSWIQNAKILKTLFIIFIFLSLINLIIKADTNFSLDTVIVGEKVSPSHCLSEYNNPKRLDPDGDGMIDFIDDSYTFASEGYKFRLMTLGIAKIIFAISGLVIFLFILFDLYKFYILGKENFYKRTFAKILYLLIVFNLFFIIKFIHLVLDYFIICTHNRF